MVNPFTSPRSEVRPDLPPDPPRPPMTVMEALSSRERSFGVPGSRLGDGDDRERGEIEADEILARERKLPIWRRWIAWIGSGMRHDIRARAPYYWSDWTDAWDYRVVPASWFIFFANVLPGIAFSLDLIEETGEYGVQEVLFSTVLAAALMSLFGGQPLLISGVTGPIAVFNKTLYDILQTRADRPVFLHFVGWVYLWGAIMHWVAALTNAVSGLQYVTRFSCDTFGFFVAIVYLEFGVKAILRQFEQSSAPAAILAIVVALVVLVVPHYFNAVAKSGYGNRNIRRFCSDYGMPITVIAATGLAYWGRFNPYVNEPDMTLATTAGSFQAINGRNWIVPFWQLEAYWVGIAFPFGFILFVLFYFDHNVSSLIAQDSEFPLKKPSAFHWDFFLLGILVFLAGLLGLPAPNGLIPQAPMHTASLVVTGYRPVDEVDGTPAATPHQSEDTLHHGEPDEVEMSEVNTGRQGPIRRSGKGQKSSPDVEQQAGDTADMDVKKPEMKEVAISVVEQRVSNLAQGMLALVLMTAPFQTVLGLIPKGVIAGLFWYMGTDALLSSGVSQKIFFLIRDPKAIAPNEPLKSVRRSGIALFVIIELLGFGATFAITQTIAAIGFAIIIVLLIPVRLWIVPRLPFTEHELSVLDGPVASPFTLESVGGSI